jgi:hypothetical protein
VLCAASDAPNTASGAVVQALARQSLSAFRAVLALRRSHIGDRVEIFRSKLTRQVTRILSAGRTATALSGKLLRALSSVCSG